MKIQPNFNVWTVIQSAKYVMARLIHSVQNADKIIISMVQSVNQNVTIIIIKISHKIYVKFVIQNANYAMDH